MKNSLREKKVKDIMIPAYDYPTVSAEAMLKDAIRVLRNSFHPQEKKPRTGRQHVFVVEDNELVGTFGVYDLLKAIEPQFLKGTAYFSMKLNNSWAIPIFWEGLFTERCREIAHKKVKEFMNPIEFYVHIDDTLLRASYSMARYKSDFVAVKDKDRLVGLIRSVDIFQEISNCVVYGDMELDSLEAPGEPWLKEFAFER